MKVNSDITRPINNKDVEQKKEKHIEKIEEEVDDDDNDDDVNEENTENGNNANVLQPEMGVVNREYEENVILSQQRDTSERKPSPNTHTEYKLSDEDAWKSATVLSKHPKRSGKNSQWVNVCDDGEEA